MPVGSVMPTPGYALYGTAQSRTSLETTGLGLSVTDMLYGLATDTHPDAVLPRALDGSFIYGYVDDFYDRIHVIPTLLNFGGVSSRQIRNFRFWSAYRHTTTLDSLLLTDFDGITLLGLSASDTFAALELVTGQIEVSLVGPKDIVGVATFTLDTGATADLSIIGTRGGSAVFAPAWTAPLVQMIEFKTSVTSSLSNREQRQAERLEPRIRLSYPYMAFVGGIAVSETALREFLRTKAHLQASGPVWTDFVRTTAFIPLGTDIIDIDTLPSWITATSTIAVYDPSTNTPILATIAAVNVGAGQITVTGGMAFDIPDGAKIYRFESMWFDPSNTVNFQTNKVSSAEITFLLDPANLTYDSPPVAPKTLAGREVFDTKEDWAGPPAITFERVGRSLDYGIGVFERKSDADYTGEVTSLSFLGKTKAETVLLRDVFMRARGRQGEFWRPVFTSDLSVKALPAVGATTLVIEGSAVGSAYIDSVMHRGVRFTKVDGTTEDYTVIAVSFNDLTDETYFELGEPWRSVGGIGNIARTNWLYVSRFASDTLTVEWITDEIGQIKMNIQSLPSETPE